MKVAIDAHTFSAREMTGGDVYVYNLVREFAALDTSDQFVVLLNAFSNKALAQARDELEVVAGPNFRFVVSHVPGRMPERVFNTWYYGLTAPRAIAAHGADVFFGTNYYCVTKGPARKVVKVHDVAPLVCPQFTRPGMFKRFRRDMLRVTAAADVVLTDTQQTKTEIVAGLDVPPGKVVPIYEAPGPCFQPTDVEAARRSLREQHRIEGPFFLFVGTVQPRKNVANILRAFDRLKQRAAIPHQLIVIGKLGWGYEEALRVRDESKWREDIRLLNYVPKDHLLSFYNAAEALVWPSYYEGIGLPLLEAMACGTPVITSDRGSMKETAGDAALLVDPDDPDDIAERMREVAEDEALRGSLRRRGLDRAAQFSWRKTASETLAALRGAGGRP